MKLLSVLALLLTVLPVRSQSIDRPESPNYLYLQFIASQTRAFIRALDDLSNNQSDLRLQVFFKSWQAVAPHGKVKEPLIDTLHHLITNIGELNAAGTSICPLQPTRYDFVFREQYYILPDSCFSRILSLDHSSWFDLSTEADYTYPLVSVPDNAILMTKELDWVLNCVLSGFTIPSILPHTPTDNKMNVTRERYRKYICLLKEWIPIKNGHFSGFDYQWPIRTSWILLNESHTRAIAEVSCWKKYWPIYQIHLEPINGRWKIVQMEEIGEWCE